MKAINECEHRRLNFGSGGFYIYCVDCNHWWICVSRVPDHPAYGCTGAECSRRPNPSPIEAKEQPK